MTGTGSGRAASHEHQPRPGGARDEQRLDWLADLPDIPMPDAVASRLDAVVARLAAERRATRAKELDATSDPLGKSTAASPERRTSRS